MLDLQNTNKEIGKTFKEIEKLHKEQKCLDEKIFNVCEGDFLTQNIPFINIQNIPFIFEKKYINNFINNINF